MFTLNCKLNQCKLIKQCMMKNETRNIGKIWYEYFKFFVSVVAVVYKYVINLLELVVIITLYKIRHFFCILFRLTNKRLISYTLKPFFIKLKEKLNWILEHLKK